MMCPASAFFHRAKSEGWRFSRVDLDPRARLHLLHQAPAQTPVAVERLHVEVDRAVHFVGIPLVQQGLDARDLLGDVPGGTGHDVRAAEVHGVHVVEVAAGVGLRDAHRVHAAPAGLLSHLVLTLVGVVGEVAHVGDVLHVGDVVAAEVEPAHDGVKADVALGVPKWLCPYTVGPQTYMPTFGGLSGSKGSLRRVRVLYTTRDIGLFSTELGFTSLPLGQTSSL